MQKQVIKSKAGNLEVLSGISGITVPYYVVLCPTFSESEKLKTIEDFLMSYSGTRVAVRSSAANEDSASASFAGMYTTKLGIQANLIDIVSAVKEVISSATEKREVISHYANERSVDLSDIGMSVIVQEMVEAQTSGVIFSHDLSHRDGYYLVSLSVGVGETIVGGQTNGQLIRVARGLDPSQLDDHRLSQLVKAMKDIETHYGSTSLDVEFAYKDDQLYILQCRPITTNKKEFDNSNDESRLVKQIATVNKSIETSFAGDILGDMIDINPLELLGASPSLLDISIFGYLFADNVVERVRENMGYQPLGLGLLRVVAGKPYTSLKASAYSFRPAGIPDHVYQRMFEVYRNAVIGNPTLQSMIEFQVFAMSRGEKLERVMELAKLSHSEKLLVRSSFDNLDETILKRSEQCPDMFRKFSKEYEDFNERLSDQSLSRILAHVATGTEMFVQVARLAFYWKNQFEETYPNEDLNGLITGHLRSVASDMQADLFACRIGELSREELIARYGHLRPGQFSIFGESYSDDPEHYLFSVMDQLAYQPVVEKRMHALQNMVEFKNVVEFMQARERMKFLFSKPLHFFASALKQELDARGISQAQASRATWDELQESLSGASPPRDIKTLDNVQVLLPNVIIPGKTNLGVITFSEAMPTFITRRVVKARICVLDDPNSRADVSGALVLLPNADPGYDFLFHSGAAGVITKVGGPASHMCIRSIELQMPACIGCGEQTYQLLASSRAAILDCESLQIIAVD